MSISRRKFTGDLAKPLVVKRYHPTLLGHSKAEVEELRANNARDLLASAAAKLDLLFAHYGIARTGDDARDYKTLAWSLARNFVPGFQFTTAENKKRGRPRGDDLLYLWLLVDAEVIKRGRKRTGARYSDAEAAIELATNSRFAERWGRYRGRTRTLANLLSKARNPKLNPMAAVWAISTAEERNLLIEGFRITKKSK